MQENRYYFTSLLLFVIASGIYLLYTEKVDALYFFSGHRSVAANIFFSAITHLGEGPVYVAAGLLAFAMMPRYGLLVGLTGLLVLGASHFLKLWFAVDRPLAFFQQQNLLEKIILVEGIQVHTGPTSFPSGHSMSAFAIYGLLAFLLPQKIGRLRYCFCLHCRWVCRGYIWCSISLKMYMPGPLPVRS